MFRYSNMKMQWKSLVVLACGLPFLSAAANDAPKKEVLTDGNLHEAWRGDTGQWAVADRVTQDPQHEELLTWTAGKGVIVNGPTGRTKNLVSVLEHGDVEAHIEFIVPKGSNSGIYFQGRYEIQVFDSWQVSKPKYSDCGGIYQRWEPSRGKGNEGFDGHAPRVNASGAPGKWQSFDVIFRAPRFDANGKKIANGRFVKVVHNGKVIHENIEVTGPTRAASFQDEQSTGPLMLQGDHGPVAYRNLWLRRIEPIE